MYTNQPTPDYYCFDSFHWHFKFWQFLGLERFDFPSKRRQLLHILYTILINFSVNFYLQFSLIYGLCQLRSARDILENAAMSVSLVICAMKAYVLRGKIQDLREIEEISKQLERKAKLNQKEYALILEFKDKSRIYMNFYFAANTIMVVLAALSILTFDTRRLMFPAYFPYDFQKNLLVFVLTAFYQWLASTIQIYADVCYDTYPGLLTFLLCQHLRILNFRIARIGFDTQLTQEENHQLLKDAVKDHKKILQFFKTVNNAVSPTIFVIFLASSFNIVCCVVLLIFFADNSIQKLYFLVLAIAYALETLLSCYYGSEFVEDVSNTTNALYSCNWCEQSKDFKKDFVIFLEVSLRKHEFSAGGLIPVNKESFVRVLRGTFFLFTFLNNFREKFSYLT